MIDELESTISTNYGTATCVKDVELLEWGTNNKVPIKVADQLIITYHECDGTLGIQKEGESELMCSRDERKFFNFDWGI